MGERAATCYDVAILGTGIGGTILGAILAKHGVRVILVEEGTHPRFAIGESTVPETTFFFRLMAARYGVPEIAHLSNHQKIRRHIASSCGVKRNFSFVYHRPSEPQRPHESIQYPTTAPPLGPDVHMYRQDIDAYMLAVAASYGASVRQRTSVTDVSFGPDAVTIRTGAGDAIDARFVVDAGGMKSLLARALGLRQEPCRLKTRSRTIYTHMVGVKPYDACGAGQAAHGLPSPLCQGTLHHLFDRGWMWVIPFDNHPTSTNHLVSVGLNLDIDRHPRTDLAPEQEFWQFVRKYPSVAKQFQDARAIREWVGTDRLQFSSTHAVGDRFAMLPHAFGFVDPLFSSGLGVTMSTINLLADRLVRASADGDFSAGRFSDIDTWMKRNIDYYDRLVSASYLAFSNFDLWNAWVRIWMIGGFYGAAGTMEMLHRFERASDPASLTVCQEYPYRGVQASELSEFATLFGAAEREMEAVRAAERSPEEAASRIFRLVEESNLWPAPWGRPTPDKRHPGTFKVWPLMKIALWMQRDAPAGVRKHYFASARIPKLLTSVVDDWLEEVHHSRGGLATLTRDFVRDWNQDWAS